MDLENDFYKRIVYRKNAIDELSSYIKFYQKHKSILYISDNNNDYSNQILAQIAGSGNAFKFCLLDSSLSYNEIKLLQEKAKDVKLIIGFVGGENTNLIKYLAKANDASYIFIPTSPCSTYYFLPYYYSPINKITAYKTQYATRIFVDERIIKNCSRRLVLNGLEMFLAYFEQYFCLMCDNKLNEYKETFTFSKVLSRFEEIFALYKNEEKEAPLVLMDNLIELAFITKDFDFNEIGFSNLANLFISNKFLFKENLSFESFCLISADLLLNMYKQMFLTDKIKILGIPNYDDVARLIDKYKVVTGTFKGIEYYKDNIREKMNKLNEHKLEIIENLESIIKTVKRNSKNISKVKGTKIITTFSLDECYDSIKMLPYIFTNNDLLDVVGGSGILNY